MERQCLVSVLALLKAQDGVFERPRTSSINKWVRMIRESTYAT